MPTSQGDIATAAIKVPGRTAVTEFTFHLAYEPAPDRMSTRSARAPSATSSCRPEDRIPAEECASRFLRIVHIAMRDISQLGDFSGGGLKSFSDVHS
jgi:hypothetical protein